MASPPPTTTRSPVVLSRISVVSRASGPSSASAPIAVKIFSFDAGANAMSGSWASTSPQPSIHTDAVVRCGATPGWARNVVNASASEDVGGLAGCKSVGSGAQGGATGSAGESSGRSAGESDGAGLARAATR